MKVCGSRLKIALLDWITGRVLLLYLCLFVDGGEFDGWQRFHRDIIAAFARDEFQITKTAQRLWGEAIRSLTHGSAIAHAPREAAEISGLERRLNLRVQLLCNLVGYCLGQLDNLVKLFLHSDRHLLFKLFQLLLVISLLHNVEHITRIALLAVESPEEGQAALADLLSFLTVRLLDFWVGVIVLSSSNNGDEQVEHEDDQEERRDEEDEPIDLAQVPHLPYIVEIADAGAERSLPEAEPVVEVGPDRDVQVVDLDDVEQAGFGFVEILIFYLVDQILLVKGVERVCKCRDGADKHDEEVPCRGHRVLDQAHDPVELLDLAQVTQYEAHPDGEGYPALTLPEAYGLYVFGIGVYNRLED